MTFDMGRAWNDAIKMIVANKDVLGIVAGVFLFLPSLAISVLAPGTELEAAAGDPDKMQAAMLVYLSKFGWLFAVYLIATFVGTLSLYALLGKQRRPTVGEAIMIGFKALLPYLASSLLVALGVFVLAMLVGILAAATGAPAIGIALGILLLLLFAFVSLRLILVGAIIAIEETYNPITAMSRSWHLVKGNTRYVFAFVLLITIAMIVIGAVLGLVFAAIGAIFGAGVSLWIEGILGALLGAAMSIIMLSVYAAIHQQLTGGASEADVETFE